MYKTGWWASYWDEGPLPGFGIQSTTICCVSVKVQLSLTLCANDHNYIRKQLHPCRVPWRRLRSPVTIMWLFKVCVTASSWHVVVGCFRASLASHVATKTLKGALSTAEASSWHPGSERNWCKMHHNTIFNFQIKYLSIYIPISFLKESIHFSMCKSLYNKQERCNIL